MNQAANILNVNADDKGSLGKRKGITTLNKMYPNINILPGDTTFLDSGLGNGDNVAIVYKGKIIMQWQTFLYTFDLDGTLPVHFNEWSCKCKGFFVVFQGLFIC